MSAAATTMTTWETATEMGATPALVIDLAAAERNLTRLADYARANNLNVRPHTKTHKSLLLARKQLAAGAVGLTAAKVSEQLAELRRIDANLQETISLWRAAGLEARIVSGGSTPTAYQSHHVRSQSEIRPGTYVFNDMNTARAGFCSLDDCAARILCTVVSTSVPGKAVIDAGTKVLTSDRNPTAPESGHGHVVEYPQAAIVRLSEEHGELDVSCCNHRPRVGERVSVIPNHICPCVNLQDGVWLRHVDGRLESINVDARGRVS